MIKTHPLLQFRDDPTPSRGSQLPRAASLIVSALGFIHDLRNGLLEPDTVRGVPLDMDQYSRVSFPFPPRSTDKKGLRIGLGSG